MLLKEARACRHRERRIQSREFHVGEHGETRGRLATVRNALVRTVELVAGFGLNGQSLCAESALLPIAHYRYARKAPDNYATHGQYSAEREEIRRWLASSLLKTSGI